MCAMRNNPCVSKKWSLLSVSLSISPTHVPCSNAVLLCLRPFSSNVTLPAINVPCPSCACPVLASLWINQIYILLVELTKTEHRSQREESIMFDFSFFFECYYYFNISIAYKLKYPFMLHRCNSKNTTPFLYISFLSAICKPATYD